ncbi:hypothetical protein ACH4YO_39495 [Streptomyces noursei]|uniref:hypothetical protein n=1 Tax=Streptomyces noursei TaxID=1971 RepID=UPI0033DB9834
MYLPANGSAPVLSLKTRKRLVEYLRVGLTPEEAATRTGITLDVLHAAANAEGNLAVALTGRNPHARCGQAIQQRADVLRGVALGMSLTDAARTAGVAATTVIAWSANDPHFKAALDAVRDLAGSSAAKQVVRMTPTRANTLLKALRDGETMTSAAERAGISRRTAYRYTKRDAEFGEQVKEALETGRRARARRTGKHTRPRTAGYRLVSMGEAEQQP